MQSLDGGITLNVFDEKLEELSNVFSSALKNFNEVTAVPVLRIMAGQNCLAEEFKKARMNIKVAC